MRKLDYESPPYRRKYFVINIAAITILLALLLLGVAALAITAYVKNLE